VSFRMRVIVSLCGCCYMIGNGYYEAVDRTDEDPTRTIQGFPN
jgi:hypothetical protein